MSEGPRYLPKKYLPTEDTKNEGYIPEGYLPIEDIMNEGYLPIFNVGLYHMQTRGFGTSLDWDKDIIYINRDGDGEMIEIGTMTEIRNHAHIGSDEVYDRNGTFVGRVGQLKFFLKNTLVKPTAEQLVRNPPSLKDLAFRQLPTSEIEAALSLNKPFSDPESKTVSSLNNSDSSGGRSRRSRKVRKSRSRRSRKSRKSRFSRK